MEIVRRIADSYSAVVSQFTKWSPSRAPIKDKDNRHLRVRGITKQDSLRLFVTRAAN